MTWLAKDFSKFRVISVANLDRDEVHRSQEDYRWDPDTNRYVRDSYEVISDWDRWMSDREQRKARNELLGEPLPGTTDRLPRN